MPRKTFEVDVNPEVIKWARETAGWSVEEIAKKLKTSVKNYENLEAGIKKPTFRQLEILAKYFKRPLSALLLPKPPDELPISSYFRILPTSESEISKELRLAIRKAKYYQSISRELMEGLGISIEPEIKKFTLENNPREVAKRERENLGISLHEQFNWKSGYEAFNNWRNAIESKNILVFQFKFPLTDARGFSLINEKPYVIVINSEDNIYARIFTLLHEYAHLILGISEIYVEGKIYESEIERWCNVFASEFLIPEEALIKDDDFLNLIKYKPLSDELLENLSKKFKVSKKAILTRLRTLNYINSYEYEEKVELLEKEMKSRGKKKRVIVKPYKRCFNEKGRTFISTVLESKESGIITTQDAIEYLSIKLDHLRELEKLL
ncbi:MAG: XRE family transcriptional regulator [candidate division WOR-3 bacterium]